MYWCGHLYLKCSYTFVFRFNAHIVLTVSRILFLRFSIIFITMIVGLMISMITAIAIITTPATTAGAPFSSNDFSTSGVLCWWRPVSVAAVDVALLSPNAAPEPPYGLMPYDDGGGCCEAAFTWFRPLRNSIALTVHHAITCDTMTKYLANAFPLIGITLAVRFLRKRCCP